MLEIAQAFVPERRVVLEPLINRAQWLAVQLADVRGALLSRYYQAGVLQQTKMFRNRRAAAPKILCKLADRGGTAAQQAENFPPCRIGNRLENQLTLFVFYCNHTVTIMVTR